jgi:hypothetical protein
MKSPEVREILADPYYLAVEHRLRLLSLYLGIAATAGLLFWGTAKLAVSFVLGAILSALNFHWLKLGVDRLLNPDVIQNVSIKRLDRKLILKYFLRYALIGVTLYVIVRVKFLDLRAAFLGLFLFVAAILIECLHQVIKGFVEDWIDGRA